MVTAFQSGAYNERNALKRSYFHVSGFAFVAYDKQIFADRDIGFIIAQLPPGDGSGTRSYQTVEPLASHLGLTVDQTWWVCECSVVLNTY